MWLTTHDESEPFWTYQDLALFLGLALPCLLGGATILVFADGPVLPFRIAAIANAAAEVEEIAITLILPKWRGPKSRSRK